MWKKNDTGRETNVEVEHQLHPLDRRRRRPSCLLLAHATVGVRALAGGCRRAGCPAGPPATLRDEQGGWLRDHLHGAHRGVDLALDGRRLGRAQSPQHALKKYRHTTKTK